MICADVEGKSGYILHILHGCVHGAGCIYNSINSTHSMQGLRSVFTVLIFNVLLAPHARLKRDQHRKHIVGCSSPQRIRSSYPIVRCCLNNPDNPPAENMVWQVQHGRTTILTDQQYSENNLVFFCPQITFHQASSSPVSLLRTGHSQMVCVLRLLIEPSPLLYPPSRSSTSSGCRVRRLSLCAYARWRGCW